MILWYSHSPEDAFCTSCPFTSVFLSICTDGPKMELVMFAFSLSLQSTPNTEDAMTQPSIITLPFNRMLSEMRQLWPIWQFSPMTDRTMTVPSSTEQPLAMTRSSSNSHPLKPEKHNWKIKQRLNICLLTTKLFY